RVAVEPGHGPLRARRAGTGVLRAGYAGGPDVLVGVGLPPRIGRPPGAGLGPLPLCPGLLGHLVALPRPLPLGQVSVPAAAELGAAAGELVQLEDPVDRRGQDRAVVADHGYPG